MIAVCSVGPEGVRPGFIPCWIEPSGRPIPLRRDACGEAVVAYVAAITEKAGLNGRFEWQGDRVVIRGS